MIPVAEEATVVDPFSEIEVKLGQFVPIGMDTGGRVTMSLEVIVLLLHGGAMMVVVGAADCLGMS